MDFRDVLVLRSPNIWGRFPALEAWIDLAAASPSNESLAAILARLVILLTPLRAKATDPAGFEKFLRLLGEVPSLADAAVQLACQLQRLAGTDVSFAHVQATTDPLVYRAAIEFNEEPLCRAALAAALELCQAAVERRTVDVLAELEKLRELADRVCLGPSSKAILTAAIARNIPVRRLNSGSLVQLGHGAHQHRIRAAETDRTGSIAESIAHDKELTKRLLRAVGVPVPEGRRVESADDAWEAACAIGPPVVVKPQDANHGRGVFINLTSAEQVKSAYAHAVEEGTGVLVERFARGSEHRLLVVGDRLVAAARGEPDQVVGDGLHTIAQLVDLLNTDPRRNAGYASTLSTVELGPIAFLLLEQQGYAAESIPAAGVKVLIHHNGDLTIDETDEVHPQVAAQCVAAARAVGLDIAGVDLIVENVSRPLEAQGGVVVEVNAGPGLQMHVQPQTGKARPVGEAIVDILFPEPEAGRIPLAAVLGPDGSAVAGLLAHLLQQEGKCVGESSARGTFTNRRQIFFGNRTGAADVGNVLLNPLVEAAVFEVSPERVLAEGLGFDRCQVAVETGLAESEPRVARVLLESLLPDGVAVLHAADRHAAALAKTLAAEVVLYAQHENETPLAEHRAKGKVVFVRDRTIILGDSGLELALGRLDELRLACDGMAEQVVLAAVATAWAMNVPVDAIRAGLASQQS